MASQDLLYLIHCVSDSGPLPSLVPMLCIQPCKWLVISFVFLRPRVLGLTVLFLPVPLGPFFLYFLLNKYEKLLAFFVLGHLLGFQRKELSIKETPDLQIISSCSARANIPQHCVHMCAWLAKGPSRQQGWRLQDPAKSAALWPGMPSSFPSAHLCLSQTSLPDSVLTSFGRAFLTLNLAHLPSHHI